MDVFTIWNSNQINLHHGFIMIVSINVAGKKGVMNNSSLTSRELMAREKKFCKMFGIDSISRYTGKQII